jgi:hypothetical protein
MNERWVFVWDAAQNSTFLLCFHLCRRYNCRYRFHFSIYKILRETVWSESVHRILTQILICLRCLRIPCCRSHTRLSLWIYDELSGFVVCEIVGSGDLVFVFNCVGYVASNEKLWSCKMYWENVTLICHGLLTCDVVLTIISITDMVSWL